MSPAAAMPSCATGRPLTVTVRCSAPTARSCTPVTRVPSASRTVVRKVAAAPVAVPPGAQMRRSAGVNRFGSSAGAEPGPAGSAGPIQRAPNSSLPVIVRASSKVAGTAQSVVPPSSVVARTLHRHRARAVSVLPEYGTSVVAQPWIGPESHSAGTDSSRGSAGSATTRIRKPDCRAEPIPASRHDNSGCGSATAIGSTNRSVRRSSTDLSSVEGSGRASAVGVAGTGTPRVGTGGWSDRLVGSWLSDRVTRDDDRTGHRPSDAAPPPESFQPGRR